MLNCHIDPKYAVHGKWKNMGNKYVNVVRITTTLFCNEKMKIILTAKHYVEVSFS